MHALRKRRESIAKDFFTELNKYLKPVAMNKELPKKKIHTPAGQTGLRLIDQNEMDEMVTLITITGKAAVECREELSHLEARLEHLALQNRNIFHPKALEPAHICDVFQETLVSCKFDNSNKLILYKMFDKKVIKHLKSLYDDLNGEMIRAGILPKIEHIGKIRATRDNRQRKSTDLAQEAENLSAEQQQGPMGRGGQQGGYYISAGGAAAGTAGGGYTGQRHVGGSGGGGFSGSAAGAVIDQRMSAGMPAGHVRQRIAGYVGGDPVTGDISGGAGVDGAVYYTRQEVVTALSGIQNIVEMSENAPLQFNAAAIKRAVLAGIGERSGGTLTKRVNQISEKTIDFIKLVFDAIIEDKGISDTIKALLLSLQIPIIKAAMLDADFFVDDKNPARQMLDRIAEAGVGVNDRKDPVCVDLAVIVKKLLKEYNEDIGAFSVALADIKELTDRIYALARETEKLSHKQVKHAHARTIVLQEIRKITLGKELAPGIRVLVTKIWPSLMFNFYLRHGKSNDEWVEMLMILAKIIESVQSHYSLDELQDFGLSYDDIIGSVSEKLRQFRKSETVVEQAIQDLRDTYEGLDSKRVVKVRQAADAPDAQATDESSLVESVTDKSADKSALTKSTATNLTDSRLEMAVDGDNTDVVITPEKQARAKLEKLPPEVQPGAWFIVFNGENKPVRRLRLAVILMQDATMVFVDHLGNVVVEKDADEFAEELARGASGIIMQHSVFDHALRSALQTIPQH